MIGAEAVKDAVAETGAQFPEFSLKVLGERCRQARPELPKSKKRFINGGQLAVIVHRGQIFFNWRPPIPPQEVVESPGCGRRMPESRIYHI